MSLLSEIKQRRITQIVITYLVGGWMAVSVVDQLVDRDVFPLVVFQVVLTLFLFGILAALIIGWYHGEKGEQEAPVREIVMLVVVGVFALGASGWVVKRAFNQATLRQALAESGIDLRRIGVTYFDDLSSDGSSQAIAEAITEGLISTLAEVDGLDVTSRNAARAVRGLDLSADSIARILDVGTVVEGTVNQVGDEIRVGVQLFEGQDGIRLSSESYRWPADKVADVSSELATEVAASLREQLGVEIRLRESQAAAPNSAAWLQVARAERSFKAAHEAVDEGDGDALWASLDAASTALDAAREAAPDWVDPLVLHAEYAYWPWRWDEDPVGALEKAVDWANQALAMEPDNAAALEWRGTAKYARFLLEVDDEDEMEDLLSSARADLERSKRLDDHASVNNTLSHLYNQIDDWSDAVLLAQRALEQDSFLDVAADIYWRLYSASYDLGQYNQADQWCQRGLDRFPDNYRFTQCQLYELTMDGAEPNVARAWELYDQMVALMPDDDRARLEQGVAQMFLGGVIGRAGLPDSANAVMMRARVSPDLDTGGDQMSMEAAMRSVIGDVDGSIDLLQRFMIAHPGHFPDERWWWRNVQGNPEFERLKRMR